MKAMIVYSAKWRWIDPLNKEKVKTQVKQMLEQGGGDITILKTYDSLDAAAEIYANDNNINITIMRSHYALVVIDDENFISLFYRLTDDKKPKLVDDFECDLSEELLPKFTEGAVFCQADVDFEKFMDDVEEVPDYDVVAKEKIQNLVNFTWELQYGRKPKSIKRLETILTLNISDAKIIARAEKEMRSGETALSDIYAAFKKGYEIADFQAFDNLWNQFKDNWQLGNDSQVDFDL